MCANSHSSEDAAVPGMTALGGREGNERTSLTGQGQLRGLPACPKGWREVRGRSQKPPPGCPGCLSRSSPYLLMDVREMLADAGML